MAKKSVRGSLVLSGSKNSLRAEWRLDLDVSDDLAVKIIERIGRTISDLIGRPTAAAAEGFLAWGPHGKAYPCVVVAGEGERSALDVSAYR